MWALIRRGARGRSLPAPGAAPVLEVLAGRIEARASMAACLSASADALAAASARSARTDDTSGGDYLDIACVFGELEMPSAVTSHVGQTTSMDGRQTETWEGISISWSYHPDRGLDGVLTVDEDDAS